MHTLMLAELVSNIFTFQMEWAVLKLQTFFFLWNIKALQADVFQNKCFRYFFVLFSVCLVGICDCYLF